MEAKKEAEKKKAEAEGREIEEEDEAKEVLQWKDFFDFPDLIRPKTPKG